MNSSYEQDGSNSDENQALLIESNDEEGAS